jgi:hypothetical protein
MSAARLSSIAFFLILASLYQPRSADAQVVPDWPSGGCTIPPVDPVEATLTVTAWKPTSFSVATATMLRRFQTATTRSWFVQVARKPVGYSRSWIPLRRRTAP